MMASSSDVSVRVCVQEIIRYDLEVKALIQDIRECRGPHSLLKELNGAVKQKSNHLRQRIEDMEQMAKEQDKETDKNVIMAETERHRKQMLSNQTAWRKANLACKLAIDNLEKDELLHVGDTSVRQRSNVGNKIKFSNSHDAAGDFRREQKKATKENLVETSSNITESLMSISRMMAQQVKQSEESICTLAISSRSLLETNEEFKAMTATIHLGRKLILKYNRRELTDKLLIFLALALFFGTVLYILKKRLFPFI